MRCTTNQQEAQDNSRVYTASYHLPSGMYPAFSRQQKQINAIASTCKMQHQKKKHIDASLSGDDSVASDINPGPEPELSSGIKCSAGAV